MEKSVVAVAKEESIIKSVERVFEELGGLNKFVKEGDVVVIKPNAIANYDPKRGITTSPEFIDAVIKVLKTAKPKEIIMAESSAMTRDSVYSMEVAGQAAVARANGITKIIDIKKETDLVELPIENPKTALKSIKVPRFLLEADCVISLPKFKAHVSAVFSCAMKHIKGIVSDQVHYLMHQVGLAESIMDTWSVFQFDLTLVDMIHPLEGYGPMGGIPAKEYGVVLGSTDPVAVDATACRIGGLDVNKAPFFKPAVERGIGVMDEDLIEIRGRSIAEVAKDIWIPYMDDEYNKWPEYHICQDGACSSCQGLLAYSMERLKSLGEYDKHAGTTVVLGRTTELPEGVDKDKLILMGDCTKKWKDHGIFVPGCPPFEMEPAWTIMDGEFKSDDDYRLHSNEKDSGYRDYDAELLVFEEYIRNLLAERNAKKNEQE